MSGVIVGPTRARAVAQDCMPAWNALDLERIPSHYTDDVAFASPTVVTRCGEPSGVLRGKGRDTR